MVIALTQAITQSVTFTQMPNGSHRCHTQHYVARNIALTQEITAPVGRYVHSHRWQLGYTCDKLDHHQIDLGALSHELTRHT